MKKYLVIGNPIEHSLSPILHNYWFKQNNIDALYEKKKHKLQPCLRLSNIWMHHISNCLYISYIIKHNL